MPETKVEWKSGYRPSNGTDGHLFRDSWCDWCDRDHEMHGPEGDGPGCSIVLSAIAGEFSYPAPNGPPEWEEAWDKETGSQVRCTAFVECKPCAKAAELDREKVWPARMPGAWEPKSVPHVLGQLEMEF